MTIQDLMWTASGRLDVPEARIESICEKLYALDLAMVRRLKRVHEGNHNSSTAFFEFIKNEQRTDKTTKTLQPSEKFGEFLESAKVYLESDVRNPEGFRASAKDAKSIAGRLMRLASKSSPDELPRHADALARALDLATGAEFPDDALVSVLLRSVNAPREKSVYFARNLIMTVFAATRS